jgi:hypothetical protein
MKLEFLAAGSADCPLIRLYDFTPEQAKLLHARVLSLATQATEQIALHDLAFVESIGGCQLTLIARSRDQGVVQVGGAATFEWGSTAALWDNVAWLIEPFTMRASSGFQWLICAQREMSVLLSPTGQW